MPDIGAMPGPWNKGAMAFSQRVVFQGGTPATPPNGVKVEDQEMEMVVEAYAYKLNTRSNVPSDYYAVNGLMRHGIQHHDGPYDPAPYWLAVGYYVSQMGLAVSITSPSTGQVYEQGPISTVGQATTSYSIGGDLNGMVGDMDTVGAGVNASFGHSYSTPAVTIAESTVGGTAQWQLALPGVGFQNDPNPKEPSYAGYEWNFGIIFEVPTGAVPTMRVMASTDFHYDNVRGIRYDTKVARIDTPWTPFAGT